MDSIFGLVDMFQNLIPFKGKAKPNAPPQHVALIMDGNRRYAKHENIETVNGHIQGFSLIRNVVDWCISVNIPEVTIFAFSVENFKRSDKEVQWLMTIFKKMFEEMIDEIKIIMKMGLCIQVIGDWGLIPEPLKPLMAKVMLATRLNKKVRLNLAIAYTAQTEIKNATKYMEMGIMNKEISTKEITDSLLEETLYLIPSRPVDIMIRTSGEVRFSDFMLWETRFAIICFKTVLWPVFSHSDFMESIQDYYEWKHEVNLYRKIMQPPPGLTPMITKGGRKFLERVRNSKWMELEKSAALYNSYTPPEKYFIDPFDHPIWKKH